VKRHFVIEGALSFLVVGLWGYVQWFLLNKVVPGDNRDLVIRMLGILDAAVFTVFTFWLGSSASSARKTDLMAQTDEPPADRQP
jgi:hypothetical protein